MTVDQISLKLKTFAHVEFSNEKFSSKEVIKKKIDNLEDLFGSGHKYEVLRLSYGLDCDKHTASEIAAKLGINGTSSYVRVSQLKKQAVDKLINNVTYEQVIDFL